MFYYILLDSYLLNYTITLTIFYLQYIFIPSAVIFEECIVTITVMNFAWAMIELSILIFNVFFASTLK